MTFLPFADRASSRASALLIVLAFVVLLTGLVIAYFSRSGTDRQLAKAEFEETSADLLGRSALDIIVAGFRQEIANGATITSSNIVPQRTTNPAPGTTPAIPNLIRRSVRSDVIPAPAIASGASAVNSTTDVSINGRSISLARWNSHYLVPKLNTGDDLSDPIAAFIAPDWVLVARDGPAAQADLGSGATAVNNSVSTNLNYVVGRYAYAVYDEGGLLDFNAAGYPYPSPSPAVTPASLITYIGRKGVIGFADLTGMRLTSSNSSTPNPNTVTKMIAWRNYATIHPLGTYPNLTSSDPAAAFFVTYALSTTRDFLTVAPTLFNQRTDQAFVTRRELIDIFRSASGSFNMLQNMGTFSRETNRPTSGSLTARWPLSRFDLFAATPPSDAVGVQTYFGLRYVPPASGPPAVGEHWEYIGTSGTTRLASIPSSGVTVASDLPLLLQSTLPGGTSTGEILSIVASLIDQRDSNNETTWIEFGAPAGPAQKAYGVDGNLVVDPSPSPSPAPRPTSVVVLNRQFRNVGELGYAYRNGLNSVDFFNSGSGDASLLDLFTWNTASPRAGIVNLNTQNSAALTALIQSAITNENSSAFVGQTDAASNHARTAYNAVIPMVTNTVPGKEGTAVKPVLGRQQITRLADAAGTAIGIDEEAKETVSRALSELTQTRTWGLMIDVIAQTGRYPPNAATLADFVVQGEKRYWLHIAIDRFTGQVIDQQLEAVSE